MKSGRAAHAGARITPGDSELRDPQPSRPSTALERHRLGGSGRQTDQGQAQSLSSEALSQPCEHPEGRSDPKPPAPARPTCGKSRRPVWSPSNVLLPSVSAAGWTPWLPHGGEGRVTTASQGAVSSHCRHGTFRSLFHSGTVTAMFEMVAVRPAWVLVTTRSRALS